MVLLFLLFQIYRKMEGSNYLEINKALWNKKTAVHYESAFYDTKEFIKGKSSLNEIELGLLGDVKGKSILHLQCHFGQDSLSLARMGADVTAIDLSDEAIKKAIDLSEIINTPCNFVCTDLYSSPKVIDKKFDIVFTSYGTIGWLPDIDKWAKVVSHFLKPNGVFVMAEFHPVIWMYDDDFLGIKYRYFNDKPIIEEETGTYADKEAEITEQFVCWNHGLAEVIGSLLSNGLSLENFDEYDYSPYDAFSKTKKLGERKYQIEPFGNKVPLVYSLKMIKK